jgi:hypothetical protein
VLQQYWDAALTGKPIVLGKAERLPSVLTCFSLCIKTGGEDTGPSAEAPAMVEVFSFSFLFFF